MVKAGSGFYTPSMIVEGVVTSVDSAGQLNVAPMGPIVHGNFDSLTLRPFQTSTTFQNLQQTRCGVFHVVDDVTLLAQAAIGQLTEVPPTRPANTITGRILVDCCRWFEFRVTDFDVGDQRTVLQTGIVATGEVRPFFGFNRARHAVLEAAILATRVHLLDEQMIMDQFEVLKSAVDKTGEVAESEAFAMLQNYVAAAFEPTQ